MLKDALLEVFDRDIRKVADEIRLYPSEAELWTIRGDIGNSTGTLCLHLIGNLNHFIGSVLGENGYVRQRELEFSSRNVPRTDLLAELEKTRQVVVSVLSQMEAERFDANFPVDKHGKTVGTDFMLLHLLTHLNYHLGQINYHRRLTVA